MKSPYLEASCLYPQKSLLTPCLTLKCQMDLFLEIWSANRSLVLDRS